MTVYILPAVICCLLLTHVAVICDSVIAQTSTGCILAGSGLGSRGLSLSLRVCVKCSCSSSLNTLVMSIIMIFTLIQNILVSDACI